MADLPVGELILVRFSPFSAPRLYESAEDDYLRDVAEGREPSYAISTFGVVRQAEQSEEDAVRASCLAANCNGKNICVTTKSVLEANGFGVRLSEPPKDHYDVILGETLEDSDTERLEAILETDRRRNPLWHR